MYAVYGAQTPLSQKLCQPAIYLALAAPDRLVCMCLQLGSPSLLVVTLRAYTMMSWGDLRNYCCRNSGKVLDSGIVLLNGVDSISC